MNGARLMLYLFGGALVVIALWMMFFETGLNRWIPIGVAAAGLLLVIGLIVMGSAEEVGPERRTREVEVRDEHHHHP